MRTTPRSIRSELSPTRHRAPSTARSKGIGRLLLALGLLAGPFLLASSARAIPPPPTISATNLVGVLGFDNGELSATIATDAPPSADLRSLTVGMVGSKAGSGYQAVLTFAGPYQKLTDDQIVFVSIQRPDGERQRVSLDGNGV